MSLPKLAANDFKAHWMENVSDDDYHSSKDYISSTGVRHLLRSPKYFHAVAMEKIEIEETEAMRFGKIAHLAILEPSKFQEKYMIIPDFGAMQSSKNRAARDAWIESQKPGSVFCTQIQMDRLQMMIESLLSHPVATQLIKDGVAEASGYFKDQETGLLCRIRPDYLKHDLSVMIDFKTTRDASFKAFQREIWNYRYDVQLAFYRMGVEAIHGRLPETSCFIAIEKEPPFDIAVYAVDDFLLEKGMLDVKKALGLCLDSLQRNVWPGLQTEVQNMGLPNYAFWE